MSEHNHRWAHTQSSSSSSPPLPPTVHLSQSKHRECVTVVTHCNNHRYSQLPAVANTFRKRQHARLMNRQSLSTSSENSLPVLTQTTESSSSDSFVEIISSLSTSSSSSSSTTTAITIAKMSVFTLCSSSSANSPLPAECAIPTSTTTTTRSCGVNKSLHNNSHRRDNFRSSLVILLAVWTAMFVSLFCITPISGHSISATSLHRHHHPSHPHAQQQQQQQMVHYHSTNSGQQQQHTPHRYVEQTYASQLRYGIQADQAIVGMRHSSSPASAPTLAPTTTPTPTTTTSSVQLLHPTRRPITSDRSVRRVDPRAHHANNLATYLSRRQQLYPSIVSTTTTTTTTTTTEAPTQAPKPLNVCPPGPPKSWQNKLDVAAKAYLAPVVLYGQLISLSEDYGGRIAATFRLLKPVKPELSVLNQSEIAEKLNDPRFDETHVKLYFIRNDTQRQARQLPFCAHLMPKVFDQLKTAERYILFTYPQVLSTREYTLPSSHRNAGNVARSHQVISLATFASPEVHSRNSSRLVRKVLCQHCAKPVTVHSSTRTVHVSSGETISLTCRATGNPTPWIEWFRNGKRLNSRKRVNIITKQRVSHLTIRRSRFKRDQGYYECRAMNVVSSEPSVRRFQVIVDRLSSPKRSKATVPPKVIKEPEVVEAVTPSSAPEVTPTSSERQKSPWYQTQPCPISSYCLNGGTCSLYEAVGEYVCQCAEGYRGQRCEFKDIFNYRHPSRRQLMRRPVI